MCRMQRERGKKKMLQRAEGAGRLLLTMGQNRTHGKDKAGLVLLKETKIFSYKHGFNSFSIKRVEAFSFSFFFLLFLFCFVLFCFLRQGFSV